MEQTYLLFKQASSTFKNHPHDFVKIASVVRKIQNWWKSLFDSEFRDQRLKVRDQYNELKEPIQTLVYAMKQLDSAFQDQDPEESSRIISEINPLINNLTDQLKGLNYKMLEAKSNIAKYIGTVAHGYTSKPEVLQSIINSFSESFKNDFGEYINDKNEKRTIGKSITSFPYFSKFSNALNKIHISDAVLRYIKEFLKKIENKEVSNDDFENFITQFKKSIFRDSTEVSTLYFPEVSADHKGRIGGEINFEILLREPIDCVLDGKPTAISVPQLKINDLSNRSDRKEILSIMSFPKSAYKISSRILTNIVKKAIWKERLPLTCILVSISSDDSNQNLHFAKVLTSALRSKIQPESSCIHFDGDKTEIEVEAYGSGIGVKSATKDIIYALSTTYNEHHNSNISAKISSEKSNIKLASSEDFDSAYRRLHIISLQKGKK
jgi:hypothetical protein